MSLLDYPPQPWEEISPAPQLDALLVLIEDPDTVETLLLALVAHGVLHEDADGTYRRAR